MTPIMWVGIIATFIALGFVANALRMIRKGPGHAANAGRLHLVMVSFALPVIWMLVLVMS